MVFCQIVCRLLEHNRNLIQIIPKTVWPVFWVVHTGETRERLFWHTAWAALLGSVLLAWLPSFCTSFPRIYVRLTGLSFPRLFSKSQRITLDNFQSSSQWQAAYFGELSNFAFVFCEELLGTASLTAPSALDISRPDCFALWVGRAKFPNLKTPLLCHIVRALWKCKLTGCLWYQITWWDSVSSLLCSSIHKENKSVN